MKLATKLFTTAFLSLGLAAASHALTLTHLNANFFFPQNGNVNAADVQTITGATGLTEVYKQNVGGNEEGWFALNYVTTFTPTSEPKGALIDSIGPLVITGTTIWALAKGGSKHGHYLWNISGWNGFDDIVMSGLYPDKGSISHVSIFSNSTTPGQIPLPGVPDSGSTVALLGLAVAALAFAKRKF